MGVTDSSFISSRFRDSLELIHQRTLGLIVRGASLHDVLDALCDGIDALDPDLISSVLLADADGQHLWPAAGRRVPEDYKQLITPLPIAPTMAACGTAAFRKERVISPDIATDSLWSGPAEKYRRMALHHGLHTAWSVPIVSDNGTLLGTFGLHHARAHSVGANELELLEKAGHIALIAIDRDRAQTALTEALAEVKKSEAELRTIVDMIPQLIAVLAPDGQALYVNQSTLEYTGLAADEARGLSFGSESFTLRMWSGSGTSAATRSSAVSRSRTNNVRDVTTGSIDGFSSATARCATTRRDFLWMARAISSLPLHPETGLPWSSNALLEC